MEKGHYVLLIITMHATAQIMASTAIIFQNSVFARRVNSAKSVWMLGCAIERAKTANINPIQRKG